MARSSAHYSKRGFLPSTTAANHLFPFSLSFRPLPIFVFLLDSWQNPLHQNNQTIDCPQTGSSSKISSRHGTEYTPDFEIHTVRRNIRHLFSNCDRRQPLSWCRDANVCWFIWISCAHRWFSVPPQYARVVVQTATNWSHLSGQHFFGQNMWCTWVVVGRGSHRSYWIHSEQTQDQHSGPCGDRSSR